MAQLRRRAAAGDLETEVLDALWDQGPLTTPEVHAHVGLPRKLAYTTILTVLQRLAKKGLVVRSSGQRSHLYSAALTRDAYRERAAQSVAATLLGYGDVGVAAFLAEARRVDPGLVKNLRARMRGSR